MKLNKNGFTLVELLAVIVVLALLMVVATRSIGGALGNAKDSAIKSEASKLVSKTYEDVQSYILDPVKYTKYTYGAAIDSNNYGANKTVTLTDGDYTAILKFDANKTLSKICITDSKAGAGGAVSATAKKKIATIKNGNSIDTWTSEVEGAVCTASDVN